MTSHTLLIFPGQGSQYRGMGSDLGTRFKIAGDTYEQASDVLGYDMKRLSFQDPESVINLTRFTQPALLTHHIACLRVLRELAGEVAVAASASAGHSLGEYSALVAAGALDFESALALVQKRGELMGEFGEGEMSALPVGLEEARSWSDKFYCAIGGINLPQQTVVAGASDDLDRLESAFQEANPRRRPVRLKTEGAFHTYYMVDAARRFRTVLDDARIGEPRFKVLSNYTGTYHDPDPQQIKSRLFFQLFHPVNWIGCLETALEDGAARVIELGGGIGSGETPAEKRPNLEGIIRKAARGAGREVEYVPAINLETIEAAAKSTAPS
ncbi:MAG: ACP S-malonyltransferase [Arenicellales bacterium]